MATAKRPKNKPTQSDKRNIKSKRKVEDDVDPELKRERKKKRKKKKKQEDKPTGKELVIAAVGEAGEKRLRMTKRKMKKLEELVDSEFRHDLPNIFELIDSDAGADEIQKVFLRASLATIMDLIPTIEAQANKSKRENDMYALNALISQGREILHDLRALQDSDEIAFRIATMIVDPAYMAIGATFVNLITAIRAEIEPYIEKGSEQRVREIFQGNASSFGQFLDASKNTVKQRIGEEIE